MDSRERSRRFYPKESAPGRIIVWTFTRLRQLETRRVEIRGWPPASLEASAVTELGTLIVLMNTDCHGARHLASRQTKSSVQSVKSVLQMMTQRAKRGGVHIKTA